MPPHRPQRTAIPTAPNNIAVHPLQRLLSDAISDYNIVAAECQTLIHRIDRTSVPPSSLHIHQPLLEPPLSEELIRDQSGAWFALEIRRFNEMAADWEVVRAVARGVAVMLGC